MDSDVRYANVLIGFSTQPVEILVNVLLNQKAWWPYCSGNSWLTFCGLLDLWFEDKVCGDSIIVVVIHDQHLGDCVILVVIYGHRLGGSVAGVVRRKHSM